MNNRAVSMLATGREAVRAGRRRKRLRDQPVELGAWSQHPHLQIADTLPGK